MPEAYPDTSEYGHVPVMGDQVVERLDPKPQEVCLDATLGLGGHAELLLPHLSGGAYIGLDRDRHALARAEARLKPIAGDVALHTACAPFADAPFALKRAGFSLVDLVLADLGVSSMQLDAPERGFSFRHRDMPLDLRMADDSGLSAAERISTASVTDLVRLLRQYGEVEQAERLARLMVERPPQTTGDLSDLAAELYRGPRQNKFLAKIFQALRIWVNDELGQLTELLRRIPQFVKQGARVVILSYHSLEDRLVKQAMQQWEGRCECPPDVAVCVCGVVSLGHRIHRRAEKPTVEEIAVNPRARSARMRSFYFEVGADA